MHVHVHKARHEERAAQVDDARGGGRLRHGRGLYSGDLAGLHRHGHAALGLHALRAIQNGSVHEHGHVVSARHGSSLPVRDCAYKVTHYVKLRDERIGGRGDGRR